MEKNISTQGKCFVIMPIGVCDDLHTEEHFRRVYEDIFIPAIKDTGYIPHRVDDESRDCFKFCVNRKN